MYEAREGARALVRTPKADLGVSYGRHWVTGVDLPATGKAQEGQAVVYHPRRTKATRLNPALYASRQDPLVRFDFFCTLDTLFARASSHSCFDVATVRIPPVSDALSSSNPMPP